MEKITTAIEDIKTTYSSEKNLDKLCVAIISLYEQLEIIENNPAAVVTKEDVYHELEVNLIPYLVDNLDEKELRHLKGKSAKFEADLDAMPNEEDILPKPDLPSDQLCYSVVRITALFGKHRGSQIGSGFWYRNGNHMFLITNKHLLEKEVEGSKEKKKAEKLKIFLHRAVNGQPQKKKIARTITLSEKILIWADNPKTDLVAVYVHELLSDKGLPEFFLVAITPEYIHDNKQLAEELSTVHEVFMYGYPNGLWDKTNGLPLIRRGITSSHPALDVCPEKRFDKASGIVDMACWPGSSGSPIFILNEGMHFQKNKGNVGGVRVIFLGVLYAGPTLTEESKLVIKELPVDEEPFPENSVELAKKKVDVMIHLGYYVKAQRVLELVSSWTPNNNNNNAD